MYEHDYTVNVVKCIDLQFKLTQQFINIYFLQTIPLQSKLFGYENRISSHTASYLIW